jgi:hypothetical protein
MDGVTLFILGLIAAIPFSIVANLLTPGLGSWVDRSVQWGTRWRVSRAATEYKTVVQCVADPVKFQSSLIAVVLRVGYVSALFTIVTALIAAAILWLNPAFLPESQGGELLITITGPGISIFIALFVVNLAGRGLRLYNNVTNFSAYQNRIAPIAQKNPNLFPSLTQTEADPAAYRRPRRVWLFMAGGALALIAVMIGGVAFLIPNALSSIIGRPTTAAPSHAMAPPNNVVFEDDFESDTGWHVFTDPDFVTMIRPGHLDAIVKAPNTARFLTYPPSDKLARVRIDAVMIQTGSAGSMGLSCISGDSLGYDYWIDQDGVAGIYVDDPDGSKPSAQIASTKIRGWRSGAKHSLSAYCLSGASSTSLELIVDGSTVLRANDNTYIDFFTPALLLESVDGGTQIRVEHFTVSDAT